MAKGKKMWAVEVAGAGQFPFDMLRYDRATPYMEEDSAIMGASDARHLRVRMEQLPTTDRWKSFGWRVLEIVPIFHG